MKWGPYDRDRCCITFMSGRSFDRSCVTIFCIQSSEFRSAWLCVSEPSSPAGRLVLKSVSYTETAISCNICNVQQAPSVGTLQANLTFMMLTQLVHQHRLHIQQSNRPGPPISTEAVSEDKSMLAAVQSCKSAPGASHKTKGSRGQVRSPHARNPGAVNDCVGTVQPKWCAAWGTPKQPAQSGPGSRLHQLVKVVICSQNNSQLRQHSFQGRLQIAMTGHFDCTWAATFLSATQKPHRNPLPRRHGTPRHHAPPAWRAPRR